MGASAAGLVLMLSVFWLQWSGGGAADFASARDEARARYLAGVMRSFFESELRRAQAEYDRLGFLSSMGLSGAELPPFDPSDPFREDSSPSFDLLRRHAPLAGDNVSGGLPVGGYVGGIDYGEPVDTQWYQDNGFLPRGRRVSLDARLVDPAAAEAEVQISSFFGRVRPDALVSGLCAPDEEAFYSDGATGSAEASCPDSYDADSLGVSSTSALAARPLYGYVPVAQTHLSSAGSNRCVVDPRHSLTPIPDGSTGTAADNCAATGGSGNSLLRRSQLIYPFVGVRRHANEARDLLVTDETSMALVLRTDFASDIPEGVLKRAAEMLAPWGGWGVLDSHEGADDIACLRHITALRSTPLATCPSGGGAHVYNEANKAIVGPHGSWRFLGRELPLKAPEDGGESAGGTSIAARMGGTEAESSPLATVGGQLFMVAVLGRRSSPLEIGLAAANAVPAGVGAEISRRWYFPGARGLVRDSGAGSTPGGFGVVYARNLTVTGDLEVGTDMIIGGPAYRDEIVTSVDLERGPASILSDIELDLAAPGAVDARFFGPDWFQQGPTASRPENIPLYGAYTVAGGHYERRALDDAGSLQRVAHSEEGAGLAAFGPSLRRATGGGGTHPGRDSVLFASQQIALPGFGNVGNAPDQRSHVFGHFRPVIGDADGDGLTRLASASGGAVASLPATSGSGDVWNRAAGLAAYARDVEALEHSPLVLRHGGPTALTRAGAGPLLPLWQGFPDGVPDCEQAPPFCRMGHVVSGNGDVLRSALLLPETELSVEGGNLVSVRGSAYGRDVARILNDRDAPHRPSRAPSRVWPYQSGGPGDRGDFDRGAGARPGEYGGEHIHTRLRAGLRGTAHSVNVLSTRGLPIEVHASSGTLLAGGRGSPTEPTFGGLEFVPPPLAEQAGRLHARTDDDVDRSPVVPVSGESAQRRGPPQTEPFGDRDFFDLGAGSPNQLRYDLYGTGCSLPPVAPRLAPALAERLAGADILGGDPVPSAAPAGTSVSCESHSPPAAPC